MSVIDTPPTAVPDDGNLLLPDAPRRMPTGLSPSSMNSYLQCERQWAFEKVYRLSSGSNPKTVAGTHAHRVLELVMQQEPAARTLESALGIHRTIIDRLNREHARWLQLPHGERDDFAKTVSKSHEDVGHFRELVGVWGGYDIFHERATKAIEGYFEMTDPTRVNVMHTELGGELVWETSYGLVPVRGIMDRVDRLPEKFDNGVMIADYKTGAPANPKFDDGADYARQIAFYAAMAEALLGERPKFGVLIYSTFGKVVRFEVTQQMIDEVKAEAGRLWSDIGDKYADDSWEPTASALCGWCAFAEHCPEGEAKVRQMAANGIWDPSAGERRIRGGIKASAPALETFGMRYVPEW